MRKGYIEIVSAWWSRTVEIVVINRQEITQQNIFTFFLSVLKLADFSLALQNGTTATSMQQEIEMVCLSIIYYRATLGD